MKRPMRLALLALVTLIFSCNLDGWGWLVSSDVDDRFADNQSLLPIVPPIVPAPPFSFIVIADTHVHPGSDAGDRFAALFSRLVAGDRFVLVCGDLVQNGASDDFSGFKSYASALGIPVYPVPGNHDLYNGGWEGYKGELGRSAYTFSAGPVRVIALDSANGTLGALQRQWLEDTLLSRAEPLCVTFTHFQFFSDKITETQQWTDYTEAYSLMHLMESSGVGLHFSGHSHRRFERTINGTTYCTVADLGSGAFVRVKVTSGALSYTVEQL
jgi:3',5'-cyclic AMP phosphodiesterase CpdA